MTKQQVAKFLNDFNVKVDDLANQAGVPRWSLRRWLSIKGAGVNLRTANKLELAMLRIKNGQ